MEEEERKALFEGCTCWLRAELPIKERHLCDYCKAVEIVKRKL